MSEVPGRDPDQEDEAPTTAPPDSFSTEIIDEIETISERGRAARAKHDNHRGDAAKRSLVEGKSARGLGVGLTVAYVIIIAPLAGYFIGRLIDDRVGGSNWSGWLTIIMAAAGVAMALAILSKHQSKL